MRAGVVTGKNLHAWNERKNMKTLIIAIAAALVTTASAQELRAPIGPQKPVRDTTPLLQRPAVEERFMRFSGV
jgi:hypothetical protein